MSGSARELSRYIQTKRGYSRQMKAPFAWILFVVFLVLKLCHVIDWSWWWVTAPMWTWVIALFVYFAVIEVRKQLRSQRHFRRGLLT